MRTIENSESRRFEGIWIPEEIWFNRELSAISKVLLVEIYRDDCGGGGCNVTNEAFASFLGTSKTTVKRHLTHLKRLGLIYDKNFGEGERVLGVKTL